MRLTPPRFHDMYLISIQFPRRTHPGLEICASPSSRSRLTSIQIPWIASQLHACHISSQFRSQGKRYCHCFESTCRLNALLCRLRSTLPGHWVFVVHISIWISTSNPWGVYSRSNWAPRLTNLPLHVPICSSVEKNNAVWSALLMGINISSIGRVLNPGLDLNIELNIESCTLPPDQCCLCISRTSGSTPPSSRSRDSPPSRCYIISIISIQVASFAFHLHPYSNSTASRSQDSCLTFIRNMSPLHLGPQNGISIQ